MVANGQRIAVERLNADVRNSATGCLHAHTSCFAYPHCGTSAANPQPCCNSRLARDRQQHQYWSDSEVIGPQVFRFEYYYLLKGQTNPTTGHQLQSDIQRYAVGHADLFMPSRKSSSQLQPQPEPQSQAQLPKHYAATMLQKVCKTWPQLW